MREPTTIHSIGYFLLVALGAIGSQVSQLSLADTQALVDISAAVVSPVPVVTDDIHEPSFEEADAEPLAADRIKPPGNEVSADGGLAVAENSARNKPRPGNHAPLVAPVIGLHGNPFSNTCDGKAIGFLGPTGERPRMDFKGAPSAAVLQCRTGPEKAVAKLPFVPCDGADGTKPLHYPTLAAEGKHRTEVRYVIGNKTSATAQATYYVHRSLDGVSCCQATRPDTAWFEAARSHLKGAEMFDQSTRLDNPFIEIVGRGSRRNYTEELLSLRRTFRLSPDQKLLLIRRTMVSRRTLELANKNSCVGLTINVPTHGVDAKSLPACASRQERGFRGGLVDAHCPDVYCTVTSCERAANGCTQVTYTFNRGPGQRPWVVQGPRKCPRQSVLAFVEYQCDAYVLNARGQGVCLVDEKGKIRAIKTVADAEKPVGLMVLGVQRGALVSRDRYVFSSKARRSGIENVLYLPE